jgi:hypothetical protein
MKLFVGRTGGSRSLRWLSVAVLVTLLAGLGGHRQNGVVDAADDDLFSSNVVTLTSSNWREHVLDNHHMALVNICRKG